MQGTGMPGPEAESTESLLGLASVLFLKTKDGLGGRTFKRRESFWLETGRLVC